MAGADPLQQLEQMTQGMGDFVVAHEVAHQYFSGIIGSDCRKEPALDEPLAQFAAGEYIKSVRGRVQGQQLMDLNTKATYGLYRMMGEADLPAAQPVSSFPSALAYAAIIYGKAPYFYEELRRTLGAKSFDRTLRLAVERHRFQMVDLKGWLATLKQHSKAQETVEGLAQRYFYGRSGDHDLGLDESGDAVLGLLLGKEQLALFKTALGQLGMQPQRLLRLLLGTASRQGQQGSEGVNLFEILRQLEKQGQ
jgi:hypothetical protein